MTTRITIITIAAVVVIGIGSIYFLGPDNQVEEIAEEIIEKEIEQVLHLPSGSEEGKIDLSLGTKESK